MGGSRASESVSPVDVIVVTWNNGELLLDCLEHVSKERIPHRLIVVDNASEDDTVSRVRRRFPDAEVIELPENVGFGRAANRGIEHARGEFMFLLNNDANIEPGFIEKLLRRFDDPRVGMVGGLLVNPANGRVDTAGIQIDSGIGGYSAFAGDELLTVEARLGQLIGPALGAALIRRELLEEIGLFDEHIFAYSEDLDLVLRASAAGWRFAVVTDARATHIGSATLGTRSLGLVRHAAHSRGYVAGRYRVGPLWLLTEAAVGLVDGLRLRSIEPLSRRFAGWREGRTLPKRELPADLPQFHWPSAIKLRLKAM
jgi:N-acetylglucosaminyl-diphospho-decaprenol L-rhamnosyltransferase